MFRRFSFGLRARIVVALAVTSVVTLVVAALALLPPLDRLLRQDEVDSLEATATAYVPSFNRLRPVNGAISRRQVAAVVRSVAEGSESQVAVVGADGKLIARDRLPAREVTFGPSARVLRTGKRVVGDISTSRGPEAEVALPLSLGRRPGVLVMRRSLTEAGEAATVVRQSFYVAGLAGLGVAAVLGFLLATQLVRRLRSLRDTAIRVAEIGPDAQIEPGPERDEVGDLTRTMAASQRKLHAQEEARRTFVATASHELRTPLTSMQLALEALEEDLASGAVDPEMAVSEVRTIRGQTARLTQLSADLLDLSRIDAMLPLRHERIDLTRLAGAVANEFAARAAAGGVAIDVSGADEAWAEVDPGSAARIVRILLDNAIKHAPRETTVTVEVSDAEPRAIRVSDEGRGVPDEEAEVIFERFHRGSGDEHPAGVGLGLAIGRELAVRMGGVLALERPCRPTTFAVALPAA